MVLLIHDICDVFMESAKVRNRMTSGSTLDLCCARADRGTVRYRFAATAIMNLEQASSLYCSSYLGLHFAW